MASTTSHPSKLRRRHVLAPFHLRWVYTGSSMMYLHFRVDVFACRYFFPAEFTHAYVQVDKLLARIPLRLRWWKAWQN